MSTKDLDKIKEDDELFFKPDKALMWVQFFKIGIIAFLFVIGGFVTFKIGEMKTCNDANGTFVEGICREINDVGIVRLCQPNALGESEICSKAVINDPEGFCYEFGNHLVRE